MLDLPRIRCASFHEGCDADPIGAGLAYEGFLVVDLALPWEAEVTAQEPIRSIVDGPATAVVAPDGSRWRALARVPRSADLDAGRRRVTVHRCVSQSWGRHEMRGPFRRHEWTVALDDVVELGRRILADGPGARSGPGVATATGSDAPGGPPRDLLVCTHGRRDQCCGSFGASLYEQIARRSAADATIDCQRISHTGGHRFAATAITFPDGYAWAHLDEGLVDLLVRRAEPPAAFARHCRGSALFAGGPAQAADRAGLVEIGWAWADAQRAVEVVGFDRATMATTLRATAVLASGAVRAVEARVVPDREIPMPTCGFVDGPEYRTETVWRVDDVAECEPLAVGQ
ncbi:MAG: hypothetical protein JST64_07385 [Actinobacteria bacterium]|nr:hypothetical protein [Actinomycetota bacterium]